MHYVINSRCDWLRILCRPLTSSITMYRIFACLLLRRALRETTSLIVSHMNLWPFHVCQWLFTAARSTYALQHRPLTRVKRVILQTSKKAFRHAGRLFETACLRQTESSLLIVRLASSLLAAPNIITLVKGNTPNFRWMVVGYWKSAHGQDRVKVTADSLYKSYAWYWFLPKCMTLNDL